MARLPQSKIVTFPELAPLADKLRASGKRIVTTNGCFDLLHWGHLQYLNDARALGDVLFCAINSDETVRRLKGKDRPLTPEKNRALTLAAVEAVDYVVIFPEPTPDHFIEQVKPSIHAKGGDYRPENLPEKTTVEKYGGRVACLPLVPGISTTAIVKRIRSGIDPA